MSENNKRHKQAKLLRIFRKIHRTMGAVLFVFFFVISITGVLLGWKKNSAGLIMAKSQKGTSTHLKDWLPLDSLQHNAGQFLHDSVSKNLSTTIDRIDVRNDKGMVKFIFKDHFWAVQLDGATGALLQIERRRSDMLENIHDGSILDHYFNTSGQPIKLIYTAIMGLALLTFTITGFWLWYGPKQMRKTASKN